MWVRSSPASASKDSSAAKALRQDCCLLSCLFIFGISGTTSLPLCWVMGREITTPSSVLPVLQFGGVLGCQYSPANLALLFFFCCFQTVIHVSFIKVLVSVLQISPHWPANPINLKMIRWSSMVILGLTDFYAACPESATPALP